MMNKSEWKRVRLGDITIQIRGVTYKKSDVCEKEIENFIPLLRANNIKDSKIIYNDVVFVNQNNVSENQILRKNDILICTSSGSLDLVGKAGQINKNENISFGAFCKVIRILDENRLNPLYLNYFFQSSYYKQNIKKIAQGANINNLKNGDIDNLEIILYSLEKQKYIENILNNLSNILNKRKEQLFELEKLVKFQFLKMFGDLETNLYNFKIGTIQDITSSIIRGPFGSALKKEFFVQKSLNSYKVYEQKNAIQKNAEIGSYYISYDKYLELKRFECFPNDIIMSCSGTIGKFYQLPQNAEKGVINQALCKFSLNSNVNSIFFLEHMKEIITKLEIKGSGIKNVGSVNYIKALKVLIPPIELQNKFAEFVKQVDKSKFVIPSKILGGVA